MSENGLFLRNASVVRVLHAVTEAQHISGCGPCRAEVGSLHVDLFLQRLHQDAACASVSQVCVMSLSLSLSLSLSRSLQPRRVVASLRFIPAVTKQPTLRLMEVALFITALELAADVGHVVQEQPPVCEVHQRHASDPAPHRQGGDPALGDGHVLLTYQFADHFVLIGV